MSNPEWEKGKDKNREDVNPLSIGREKEHLKSELDHLFQLSPEDAREVIADFQKNIDKDIMNK